MPALKYILQTKKNPANIYVRLMVSKDKDFKRKTGLFIDPKKWNTKKGMPRHPGEIYHRLVDLEERIWNGLSSTKNPDGPWLDEIIKGKGELLSETIEMYIKDAPNLRSSKGGVGLSVNRIKNLGTFSKLIIKFRDVPISRVGKAYGESLIKWMSGYSNNYTTKTVENLKAVIRYADKKGIAIDRSLLSVDVFWEHKTPVVLTLEELEHIKGLDLDERLANVRKWLLLGCYTGQRVGDLFSIKESDIVEVQGKKMVEYKQEKTGNPLYIPLIPEALEVLEDGFPKVISVQKFNNYLKDLMGVAEIDKKITSHCMRRSFATNFYGKIPTPLIMSVTGHRREQSFLLYIGKSEYNRALEFLDSYGKK